MKHDFCEGKYTVEAKDGNITALRYGQLWQDLTGNNLVYWMLVEVEELKEALKRATVQSVLPKEKS